MPFVDLREGVAQLFEDARVVPATAAVFADPSLGRVCVRTRVPERWRAVERQLLAELARDL